MPSEPHSPNDPMLARLVGGPYDGQTIPVPAGVEVWEIAESWRRISPAHEHEEDAWARGRRHAYRLDPHWREFVGAEPLPFVYAGVVVEEKS